MRFAIDSRTATEHFPGIGRYVFNLAQATIRLLSEDERLFLLHQPNQPSPWDLKTLDGEQVEMLKVPVSPFTLRQQWSVPSLLRKAKTNLYHSPYYLMPYRPNVPSVVTIHDLIPLCFREYFTTAQRLIFAVTVRLAVRAATRVIAVSQATAQDLQQNLGLPECRLVVIPEAADPTFYPRPADEIKTLRRKRNLPKDYILYLGSNKPHKNLTRLVEAWARLKHTEYAIRNTLVIAGAWDDRYPEARQRADDLALGTSVLWLGPLPEQDLPPLYSGATAFIFPSLYEGFGLPPLEAMACGAPVACSDTSSLPEVVGDAALLFDPTDVESIAETLRTLLKDEALRAELRAQGLKRAARFSWERTAKETLTLYRQVAT